MSSEEGRGKHYNGKWDKGQWKKGNGKGLGGLLLLKNSSVFVTAQRIFGT